MRKLSLKNRLAAVIVGVAMMAALALPLRSARLSTQETPATENGKEKDKQKANQKRKQPSRPLAGYTALQVEPFTVEKSEVTKDFPAGEEANLQTSAIAELKTSNVFDQIIGGTAPSAETPPTAGQAANGAERKLLLSTVITSFSKGSSAARFMTWPLPVGVSKVRAVFTFRDAQTNEEVYRFEKEAKFQAAMSGGIATKEEQLKRVKGGLVEALIKEIKRKRTG